MRIGVPKEIKNNEYRVGLTPGNVRELTKKGHSVWVEHNAGEAIGFTDERYRLAGAEVVGSAEEVFAQAEMIIKVKEPQLQECRWLRADQLLFSFLHLAADPNQAMALMESGCIAFAYETVTDAEGGLPLLTPSSEIAGRLSIQAGAYYLEKMNGGRGILLGAIPGVVASKVMILGGGTVGTQAVRVALGMGSDVYVFDKSMQRLRELNSHFVEGISTCFANAENLEEYLPEADLLIGAVLIPGATAPKIVSRSLVAKLKPGSVIVDVSIDQGGCFETSRPTTHSDPTYIEEGVVHYCVTNMPAGVPLTSTLSLTNVSLPFIMALADEGYRKACLDNPYLLRGLNVYRGKITHAAVARALNVPYSQPETILNSAGS
jgi:alanine dehydrogenase